MASTPFPAEDDGSIALGFMVSLEDRRAGHFTWDLAAFPQCSWRDLSTGRRSTRHPALARTRSPLSVHVAYHGSEYSWPVFPPLLRVWWVTLILVPPTSFSDALLIRNLNEQNAIF